MVKTILLSYFGDRAPFRCTICAHDSIADEYRYIIGNISVCITCGMHAIDSNPTPVDDYLDGHLDLMLKAFDERRLLFALGLPFVPDKQSFGYDSCCECCPGRTLIPQKSTPNAKPYDVCDQCSSVISAVGEIVRTHTVLVCVIIDNDDITLYLRRIFARVVWDMLLSHDRAPPQLC